MKLRTIGALWLVTGLVAACNDVPVRNLTSTYQVQVQEIRDRGKPAKLDVLWVIDDSPSMCQEQQNLARSFKAFLDVFQKYTAIDMQLAVTTTNVCPTAKDKKAVRGRFLYQPAVDMPPDCVEKRVLPCLNDAQCQARTDLPDPAGWVCESKPAAQLWVCDYPPEVKAGGADDRYPGDYLYTMSTQCRYKCDRDNDAGRCARVFGMPDGCSTVSSGDRPSMCEASSCDTGACLANDTLPSSVDCATRCRGAECATVCAEFLQDAAACQARCQAANDSCYDVCRQVSKTVACQHVCGGDNSCEGICGDFLHDPARCAQVCQAADCRSQCRTTFKNQEFLCTLACNAQASCSDRCTAEFGIPEFRCLYPGDDPTGAGCLQPPATGYCPGLKGRNPDGSYQWEGPTILNNTVADQYLKDWIAGKWAGHPDWDPAWKSLPTGDTAEEVAAREVARAKVFELLFQCMATVGAAQSICGNQEQGLRAAWMALDPDGENRNQARAFLRDDAYLLIVVMGDEDDCSAPEYEKSPGVLDNVVPSEDFGRCSCLRDENGCLPNGECDYTKCLTGGAFDVKKCPLYSTARFVNLLRSLKPDPAQVVFATITGDVLTLEDGSPNVLSGIYAAGARSDDIRKRYFDCMCDAKAPTTSIYNFVCLSRQGKAALGARYIDVARAFGQGSYGQFSNICSDQGIEPSLEAIANLVIPLLTQICLPRPLDWPCETRCETLAGFQDREKCQQACGAEDCFKTCQDLFGGIPGCAEICASGEAIEVYQYDSRGRCARTDSAGNCLPLTPQGQGDAWDYQLVANSPVCPLFDVSLGERLENALLFSKPLEYNDRIEIVYRSRPFACQKRCLSVFLDQAATCDDLCKGSVEDCIEGCVKGAGAQRCAFVCGVKVDSCIQHCQAVGGTACNEVCRN
ncbi:hypothetical protein KBD49_02335 [Myxococcota bacterium]|nr:hypothetical protein [Myxococcota bacterium]